MTAEIKLILVDPDAAVCAAMRRNFARFHNAEVVHGLFEEVPAFDCLVSPANSFGLMHGGADAAIVRFFGESLMRRVQQCILDDYLGEQPVGTSFIVGTGHPKHPYVAHTPTMRVPMSVVGTDSVYRAMWAMLLAVRAHNRRASGAAIRVVACTGLGTGSGGMSPKESARQMAVAYGNYLSPPRTLSWKFAGSRQSEIGCGGSPTEATARCVEDFSTGTPWLLT